MKEAIGGTSLFLIFISIMSVFAIYISLSVNWNMAYKAKDEIIFFIEKNKGINEKSLKDISNYLSEVGYFNTGNCGKCFKGYMVAPIAGDIYGVRSEDNANYCVLKNNWANDNGIQRAHYSVRVFFQLDLPIIRRFRISIDGETRAIEQIYESNKKDNIPASIDASNDRNDCWEDIRSK